MELIYSMRRKPLKCEPPQYDISDPEVIRPIVTISCGNIIAFSSHVELSNTEGDTWGGHVYVCDMDTPWDCHKVVSTDFPVSALEWDMEGKHLLVATNVGEMQVFGQKDYLLNEWISLYSATFPEERIIKAIFFHNGRRIVSVDKKPDALITERLQALRVAPTLKGFGGAPRCGVVALTHSGLVVAMSGATSGAGGGAAGGAGSGAASAHLSKREHVQRAAFTHSSDGGVVVAALCRGRVLVARVRLRAAPLALQLQQLAALPADCRTKCLTWTLYEDCESLLVAGSTLSLWRLGEVKYPVHKLLWAKGAAQGNTTAGGGQKPASDCFTTVKWQQAAAWPLEPGELPLQLASCGRAALLTTRRLVLLHRDTAVPISSVPLPTRGTDASSHAAKKPKYTTGHAPAGSGGSPALALALSSGAAAVLDARAQLRLYRVPHDSDMPLPHFVQEMTSLLEYCAVAGHDPLDLILSWKPNIVDAVYERLTENFQRQPQPFQQYYSNSWLKLRIALCRSSSSPFGASSWSWLTSSLMLAATWASAADRTDLEPDDVTNQMTLLALESKESPEPALLQPLRRPLQRAIDVAVTALASLPPQGQGYSIWLDPCALALARACVWARGRGDAALGRLLARARAEDVAEECATLCSQAASPRVWEALPRCCVSAPHGAPYPLHLEYGVEPEYLKTAPEPPFSSHCDVAPSTHMDAIRYMYLGGGSLAALRRQCGRCGARALPHGAARHSQRGYDARFTDQCRCGGKWTLMST